MGHIAADGQLASLRDVELIQVVSWEFKSQNGQNDRLITPYQVVS